MKIERLFQIIYILVDKKTVTAKELADRFEVSTRTIYRDIDILSSCNIPVYTKKGKGGGISILDNFKFNSALLIEKDQREVLSALKGLSSMTFDSNSTALTKLSGLFKIVQTDWIDIDFSYWSRNKAYEKKFRDLKDAIINSEAIKIEYASTGGQFSQRMVYPLKILFKGVSWYLYAYCTTRDEYRLFKLSRIIGLCNTGELFEQVYNTDIPKTYDYTEKQREKLELMIDEKYIFRFFDDFEDKTITSMNNGSYHFSTWYYDREWIVSYLLSFGSGIECIHPSSIREDLRSEIEKANRKYL
jgi:predicted DNA-binding transcriptional regulator YafY